MLGLVRASHKIAECGCFSCQFSLQHNLNVLILVDFDDMLTGKNTRENCKHYKGPASDFEPVIWQCLPIDSHFVKRLA